MSPLQNLIKLLSFLYLYLLFYYSFLAILILRGGVLNSVNFITIVFSNCL